MPKKIIKLLQKHKTVIMTFALFTASVASPGCSIIWYQEKEPEGLADFVARKKRSFLYDLKGGR